MDKNDNPGVKLPPPLVFIVLGLAGVGLQFIIPMSIGIGSPANYIGVAVILVSFTGIVYITKLFKRHKTAVEPWESTSKIITISLYKYSRNPAYIFACGIPIGLGIVFNTYWALFAFIPSLMIIYQTAVKKEEKYLETKFGQEYLSYKDKVRRWL